MRASSWLRAHYYVKTSFTGAEKYWWAGDSLQQGDPSSLPTSPAGFQLSEHNPKPFRSHRGNSLQTLPDTIFLKHTFAPFPSFFLILKSKLHNNTFHLGCRKLELQRSETELFLYSLSLDNYSSKIDIFRPCWRRNRHANFCEGEIFIIPEQYNWRKGGKKAVISRETSPGSIVQPFTLSYTPSAVTGLPEFVLQWSVLKRHKTTQRAKQ